MTPDLNREEKAILARVDVLCDDDDEQVIVVLERLQQAAEERVVEA